MNCDIIQKRLADYVSGDLDAAQAAGIEGHLSHCYLCQEELAELKETLAACRQALRHPLPVDRWDLVHLQITKTAPQGSPAWQRAARRRLLVGALAASIVFVLGLWQVWAPPTTPPRAAPAAETNVLAVDGLVAPSDTLRLNTPLQRYAATVNFYFQALNLTTPTGPTPGTTVAPPPKDTDEVSGAISSIESPHTYA